MPRRLRRRRFSPRVVVNGVRHLVRGAARSWRRNLGATTPALGSMALLLLLAGLAGVTGYGLSNLAAQQAADAAVLHVYLRDDAALADVSALQSNLEADRRVASVGYTSKSQALAQASHRPGLSELAGASGANPFPASLDLKVRAVGDVGALAGSVKSNPAVDPVLSTSYDPGAYGRLESVLRWLAVGGGIFLVLLGLVAVMVTVNSIRAAIHARREELRIMQLVGAPRWMVRGPFVLEGAMTGAAAGVLAAVVVLGVALAMVVLGASHFSQWLPGVGVPASFAAAGLVLLSGLVLGSGSSVIGVRQHLE
jgi:cell division transport system permease protein